MPEPSPSKAGLAIGAMFFAFFGAIWLVWWCIQAYGASPGILALIAAGGGVIFVLALRQLSRHRVALAAQADSPATQRLRRIFKVLNIAQWLVIFAIVLILANTGRSVWIPASIIFVVGLHFLPLAALFGYRWHYVTGSALVLLAVTYPFVSRGGPANPVGQLGTGLILWASALGALVANPSVERTAS